MKANRAQICSIFGLTKYEFDTFVAAGLPATRSGSGRGFEWTVDTVQAHKWLVSRAVREAPTSPDEDGSRAYDGGEVLSLDGQRARLAKEQADLTSMKNAEMRRELAPVSAMTQHIERLVGAANTRLGALPSKLAHVIRPDDPATARRHLELAIEEVRSELRRLEVEDAQDAAA